MNINKKSLIPSLILSAGLSLVTLYLGYQQAEQSFQSREYAQVVTVKPGKMIQPYSPIIPSDLVYKEVPKGQILPGSIHQTERIIGKVAWMPIGSGETVLDWKLMDGKLLPKKQEARYEIELSEFTPMSEIRRGDHVKVWVNYIELDPEKFIELGQPKFFQKTNDTADLLFTSQVVAVKDGSGAEVFSLAPTPVKEVEAVANAIDNKQPPSDVQNRLSKTYRGQPRTMPNRLLFNWTDKQYQAFVEAKKYGTLQIGVYFNEQQAVKPQ